MTSWILSYGAGWLITLSPCVLPILPLLLSGAANKNRLAPLLMALGLALSFALLGTLIGLLGDSIGLSPAILRTASAVLLLTASIFMLVPQLGKAAFARAGTFANLANDASSKLDNFGLWGNFLTGALLGAVWAPCSGPALVAAAGLAADAGTAGDAFIRLLFFGFGAATPLLLIAYGTRGLLLGWLRKQAEGINRFFGFFLGAVALLILTGYDLQIQELVISWLPQHWLLTITSL
jgi:cytochrome c-type biogenesis protein